MTPPLCIIQARLDSERLPQKMLLSVMGKPLLWWAWVRAVQVFGPHDTVIACPMSDVWVIRDSVPEAIVDPFAGEEWNVLGRFVAVARVWRSDPSDLIVRITPDDWPIQPFREWVTLGHLEHLEAAICAGNREAREHVGHLFGADAPPEINTEADYQALLRSYGEERR